MELQLFSVLFSLFFFVGGGHLSVCVIGVYNLKAIDLCERCFFSLDPGSRRQHKNGCFLLESSFESEKCMDFSVVVGG